MCCRSYSLLCVQPVPACREHVEWGGEEGRAANEANVHSADKDAPVPWGRMGLNEKKYLNLESK